jgi:hypothetical protein
LQPAAALTGETGAPEGTTQIPKIQLDSLAIRPEFANWIHWQIERIG